MSIILRSSPGVLGGGGTTGDPHGACITLKEEGRTEDGLLLLHLSENLPRPPLDFDRTHRHDDVTLTLDVRNGAGLARIEQIYQRLLRVPGVRRGAGEPLPPAP